MAISFSKIPYGLHLCDSMVPVSVTIPKDSFDSRSTMRKVEMRAYRVVGGAADYGTYEMMSWEPDDDSKQSAVYTVDIQHMLRALIGNVEIDPNDITDGASLPIMEYALSVGRSYLFDGRWEDDFKSSQAFNIKGGMFAMRGQLSDYERMALADDWITEQKGVVLSRKPHGEVACPGAVVVKVSVPKSDGSGASVTQGAPTVSMKTAEQVDGIYIDNVYAREYAEFMFINSLGVPETVCARTLEQRSVTNDVRQFVREQAVASVPDARGSYISMHDGRQKTVMNMSSGACTAEWAEWWSTEFLTSSKWWIRMAVGGTKRWVPCSVSPKSNSSSIYDRSKSEASHVDFTVTMAWSGSDRLSVIHNS